MGDTGRTLRLRFGAQTDTRIIRSGTSTALTRDAVANYIAKYATKDHDVAGMPDYRLRSITQIRELRCPSHTRRLMETAWALGYRRWAHQLGRGGHFLTKSRRFSVTFGQLRTARKAYRRAQRHTDGGATALARLPTGLVVTCATSPTRSAPGSRNKHEYQQTRQLLACPVLRP